MPFTRPFYEYTKKHGVPPIFDWMSAKSMGEITFDCRLVGLVYKTFRIYFAPDDFLVLRHCNVGRHLLPYANPGHCFGRRVDMVFSIQAVNITTFRLKVIDLSWDMLAVLLAYKSITQKNPTGSEAPVFNFRLKYGPHNCNPYNKDLFAFKSVITNGPNNKFSDWGVAPTKYVREQHVPFDDLYASDRDEHVLLTLDSILKDSPAYEALKEKPRPFTNDVNRIWTTGRVTWEELLNYENEYAVLNDMLCAFAEAGAKKKCPDCLGTGKYTGFSHIKTCKRCEGSGEVAA